MRHEGRAADRTRRPSLEQVLVNVGTNARDAIEGTGHIEISARIEDDSVVIAVADTGRGMRPEILQRAMEPFFTTKSHADGTGLGLSIAYGIMMQHGGDIEIQSEPNNGTTVTLRLPCADAVGLPGDVDTGPKLVGLEMHEGTGVLVVEDDPSIRAAAVAILESVRLRVFSASSSFSTETMCKQLDGFRNKPGTSVTSCKSGATRDLVCTSDPQ